MAKGGSAEFNRYNAARNRAANTTCALVSRPSNPASASSPNWPALGGGPAIPSPAGSGGVGVWHRPLPVKLREQPNGWLLYELVFGVGARDGSNCHFW